MRNIYKIQYKCSVRNFNAIRKYLLIDSDNYMNINWLCRKLVKLDEVQSSFERHCWPSLSYTIWLPWSSVFISYSLTFDSVIAWSSYTNIISNSNFYFIHKQAINSIIRIVNSFCAGVLTFCRILFTNFILLTSNFKCYF